MEKAKENERKKKNTEKEKNLEMKKKRFSIRLIFQTYTQNEIWYYEKSNNKLYHWITVKVGTITDKVDTGQS